MVVAVLFLALLLLGFFVADSELRRRRGPVEDRARSGVIALSFMAAALSAAFVAGLPIAVDAEVLHRGADTSIWEGAASALGGAALIGVFGAPIAMLVGLLPAAALGASKEPVTLARCALGGLAAGVVGLVAILVLDGRSGVFPLFAGYQPFVGLAGGLVYWIVRGRLARAWPNVTPNGSMP